MKKDKPLPNAGFLTKEMQRMAEIALADLLPDALPATEITTTAKPKPKPQIQQNQVSNKRLDAIIEKMIEDYHSMREHFKEYCKAAIDEGFTANEAWQYISKRLVNIVPKSTLYRWAEKELPLEAKKSTKPRGKKIPIWESSENERSSPQKQLEQAPGRINQVIDEYEIDKVDDYDLEHSHQIIKRMHQIIQTQQKRIEELEASSSVGGNIEEVTGAG